MKGYGFPSANCIKQDFNGDLWIGTKQGLFFYTARSNKVEKFTLKDETLNNSIISDIHFDKNKQLWLATDGNGIAEQLAV